MLWTECNYKEFNLKLVVQTGALPAERLDVSFEQKLAEKCLEKENLHSDSEEKRWAVWDSEALIQITKGVESHLWEYH